MGGVNMKRLIKGFLALALVLTVVSSVTVLPTNTNTEGGITTLGFPAEWGEWGLY